MARSKKSITPPTRKKPPSDPSQPLPIAIVDSGSCAQARTYRQCKRRRRFLSHHIVSNLHACLASGGLAQVPAQRSRRARYGAAGTNELWESDSHMDAILLDFQRSGSRANAREVQRSRFVDRSSAEKRKEWSQLSWRTPPGKCCPIHLAFYFNLPCPLQFAARGGATPGSYRRDASVTAKFGRGTYLGRGHSNFASHGDLKVSPGLVMKLHYSQIPE